jgi:TPR repeat protein
LLCVLALVGCDGLVDAVQKAQAERLAMMRGCDAHLPADCKKLADAEMQDYRGGADPGHDWTLKSAASHYDQACTGGIVEACLSLVKMEVGAPARALPPARHACDLGAASGCLLTIEQLRLLHGSGDRDHAELVARATRACDLDVDSCPEAAREIAWFDPVSAEALALRPCEAKQLEACGRSAALGASGDMKQRLEAHACDAGVLTVCVRRAYSLIKSDPVAARELYRRTCARGSDQACGYLGQMLAGIPIE